MSRAVERAHRIAVGILLVALVGCGGGQADQGGLPSITADQANRQYHEEAAKWDLPAGWAWPAKPYSGQGPDGARAVYGTKIGQVDASRYWFCAWNRALVDAGTEENRKAALGQVLRLRETPYYQIGLESTAPIDATLAAAEAGDLSELARYTELNCTVPGDGR